MFEDRVFSLNTPEEAQAFLVQHPSSVIFKAGTCHKTMQGFGHLQAQLEAQGREDLAVGVIKVVEDRPASDWVTEVSGMRHESPQVILFKEGSAVYELNNWGITPGAVDQGLLLLPEGTPLVAGAEHEQEEGIAPYRVLLERYLQGGMDKASFEIAYTTHFRSDASLRGPREVEILGGIFGDADRHAEIRLMMTGEGSQSQDILRLRVMATYEALKNL